MKNVLEKVYLKHKSPKLHTATLCENEAYSAYESPLTDKYDEYIRKDVAENMAENMVKAYLYSIGWSDLITNGQFAEFLISRKAQKE